MSDLFPRKVDPLESRHGPSAESSDATQVTPPRYGILIVDDEECVRTVLENGMRQRGFAVWLAGDGQEALRLYRRESRRIDVVLLDVRMPKLDGPGALAGLQAINPQVRCCFMSGDLGSHAEWTLCNLGAAAVIHKPFRSGEVAQVLWELASNGNGSRFS